MTRTLKKKYIKKLKEQCEILQIPYNICYGILMIENTYRKCFFRLGENGLLIVSLLLNLLFNIPIKNYTVGICQVGISTILAYNENKIYQHLEYIKKVSVRDALKIIKALSYKDNIKVFCYRISQIYNKRYVADKNESKQAQIIGEEYNGKYIYGLDLQNLVCDMIENKC